jgi:hypothetical protein
MTAPPTLEASPAERPPPRSWWTPGRIRVAGLVTGVVLVLAGAVTYLLWSSPGSESNTELTEVAIPVSWQRPVVNASGLASRSGVRITQVAVTGAGGLVDLRYQVVDANEAATLHNPATPPAVIDEQTGLVIHQLLMNHAHTGTFRAGVTYYLVFINPDNWLQRGSKVTVLLGNAAVEHVVVQ